MTPAGGVAHCRERRSTVRRKHEEVETREEKSEEVEMEEGDAASRIPSGRPRRRGRS